jgi:hypothetical protein
MSDIPRERQSAARLRRKQLRELLEVQAKDLQEEALRSGGAVAPEKLESLQHLASLVEIEGKSRPRPAMSHWPIAVIFAATLLIASVLLFSGPRSTEIEMDLHVDQLAFALSQRQVLSEPLQLSSLGLTGISQLELPRAANADARTLLTGRDFDSSIALTALPTGELSLPELVLPEHSRIVVERSDVPLQYRFVLPAANGGFSADVNGPVRISSIAGEQHPINFPGPRSIVFKPQAQQADLDLTFLKLPQKLSRMPLAVQDLSLIRIDDRRGIDALPARRVSTILSGSLYFEDLNGKTLSLRPGELIELDASQGQIESLQLKDDIAIQFRGHVRGIASGPADIRRSLMPNWLEWLKARQGLSLLWGSAIYVFGLIAGVLRWLRTPE